MNQGFQEKPVSGNQDPTPKAVKTELTLLIKKSREFTYLGLYDDAQTTYADSVKMIKNRLGSESNPKSVEMLKNLLRLIDLEMTSNQSLNSMISTHKLNRANHSPPIKVLPFNKPPFSFHEEQQKNVVSERNFYEGGHNRRNSNMNFQEHSLEPRNNPARQPNSRGDDVGRLSEQPNVMAPQQRIQNRQVSKRESNSREHVVAKDPLVWDPPSPSKQKQKPKSYQPSSKNPVNYNSYGNPNNNYLDKKNRNYPKPWLKPDTGAPTKSNNVGGPASNSVEQNIVINGVEKKRYLYTLYPDGNGPDSDLINMIENNLILTNPGVSFDDIAGLRDAKEALTMYVVCALNMKNFFKGIRSPPKGILLYGPPGTGKTMLAKAIATTGKTTFINVNPAALASKWRGDSEKLVRLLFDMGRYYSPSTIFIDEIDSLLSERSSNEHESSRKVKTQFFTEIDGINGSTGAEDEVVPKVFILAATNRPWDLDDAILRRLTKRVYIPLPDDESRKRLFELKLRNIKLANDIDFEHLVKNTDRYNSDDIESLCREAANAPFKRIMNQISQQNNTQFLQDLEQQILSEPITNEDFVKALQQVKPSSSDKYSEKYTEWSKNHGST